MKITIICVYNDENKYKNELLEGLSIQDIDYELKAIDNSNKSFSSSSTAYNYAVKESSGDVLIFAHQDIRLKTSDALRKMAEMIGNSDVGDIICTQGVKEKSKVYYSNITAGDEYNAEINNDFEYEKIDVACVDEGFFGMRRETFDLHKFDEELCDNWHLYCVEQCLYARENGHKVWVCPIQLHHSSYGNISWGYMKNLRELCKRYRKSFKYIWTTCYKVRTNPVYINSLLIVWVAGRKLRGKKLG